MSAPTLEEQILEAIDDVLASSKEFDKVVSDMRAGLFPSLKEHEVPAEVWGDITAHCYHTCSDRLMKEVFQ